MIHFLVVKFAVTKRLTAHKHLAQKVDVEKGQMPLSRTGLETNGANLPTRDRNVAPA